MDVISSSIETTKKILLAPFTLTKKGIQLYASINRFQRFTAPKARSANISQKVKNTEYVKEAVNKKNAPIKVQDIEINEGNTLEEVISEYKNKNKVLDAKKEELLRYKAERVQNIREQSFDKDSKTHSINYKEFYKQRAKERELEKEMEK